MAEFRGRPLGTGPYTFVWADALTQKVREGGRVVCEPTVLAVAYSWRDIARTRSGAWHSLAAGPFQGADGP
ncbi:transposase [Streptomyces sp. NPDC101151]|uniref:transposase n=1 Tax=Streptomyces sp. NPDC101151 TaxID=3366115 RepID=UPI0038184C3A